MKQSLYILSLFAALLFVSCEKPGPDSDDTKVFTGYRELLEAYDAGRLFKKAVNLTENTVVMFEDGSSVTVPFSSFRIHNHKTVPVPEISVVPYTQWWSVNGVVQEIKVLLPGTPKEQAEPVYVYYDSMTLYMALSNRETLRFNSKALIAYENDRLGQEEIANVIELWTGVPATDITENEFEQIDKLSQRLKERIVGQDEAVESVSAGSTVQQYPLA